ncbi:DNA polymerase III subunit alpha [Ornithinibacillus xuwenensis]|uniref:DNA polymerase III subunit alpha n=1 Tax=Ornithinibacillus xuwenensis TaxID=3144668 RepID=A0ABU9XBE1_9BACI
MSFTHLQVKTGYSFLNSTITTDKLIKKATELNFSALSITDENVLHGVIPFYKACVQNGIKPIIGMTTTIVNADESMEEIILLAKNNAGYNNLVKLSSYIQTNQVKGITKDELHSYTDQLVGILPSKSSSVQQLVLDMNYDQLDHFLGYFSSLFAADDFYLGIDDHGNEQDKLINQGIKAYADSNKINVVAINNVCYLNEKDVYAFDCLQAMKQGKNWSINKVKLNHHQQHLRATTEMEQIFSYWPEAIEETKAIEDKCTVTFDFGARMLPSFPVPNHTTAADYLEKICLENIKDKYTDITMPIKTRLHHELTIIKKMNFSDYFLIVWDFIKYAKEQNIMVGPGRGSSAGSIVAYTLGITDVDPMKHDLLFERFLNPERITMPDIDIDFSDQRRDEVIAYVREKYGPDHVAQIITFGTFAARSIIRELGKTMEVDQQDIYFILKQIPNQTNMSLASIIKSSNELANYIQSSESLKRLFQIAAVIEGIPRHASTHAAGVVISERPLMEHVPLTKGAANTPLTQFTMTDLESIGLLKIDFLGLRNLTLIERVLQSIQYKEGKELLLSQIPENDPKTFDLLKKGKTNGVFQLESDGMKQVLERLRPSVFDDIVAVNALYRPGPMDFIPTYIERKHGRQNVSYPHPDLKPILESTYGVLIYQEQIMQIAHHIAGYTLGQADVLRRAVSKKNLELMDKQQEDFIRGCIKNGYDKNIGEEIFAWIVKFSNYGFPKSHAVAYSKISYQLAYLKAHYPKHFYAELLTSIGNQHEKIHMYIKEMKELKIPIGQPSINKSFGKFSVEKNYIRMGLLAIKGIGNQSVQEIIQARKHGKFKNLFDFCLRVSPKLVNRATIESLILAGAFDETYTNRASLLASIDQAVEQGELFREFSDQPNLFQDELDLDPSYVEIEDFSQIKKLSDEKEFLGVYVSSHPLIQYRGSLRENGFIALNHAVHVEGKNNSKSAVIIQSIKTIRTKRGEPMAFVTVSDETEDMDAVIFPELYRDSSRMVKEEMLVFITGKIERRNGRLQWLLTKIEPFNPEILEVSTNDRLFIKTTEKTSKDALKIIQKIALENPGSTPIYVYHEEQKRTYQLAQDYFIQVNKNSLNSLYQYFGKPNVVFEKA